MYKCPHLGACYNTTTNIWDNFFISKIFKRKVCLSTPKNHIPAHNTPQIRSSAPIY